MNSESKTAWLLQIFLFLFIVSLFLTLGSDRQELVLSRMIFGGAILVAGIGMNLRRLRLKGLALAAFAVFFLFEILRSLWGLFQIHLLHHPASPMEPFDFYAAAPLKWVFYFGFFLLAYSFFDRKPRVTRLMNLMTWAGFFLAINAIPALLKNTSGEPGYSLAGRWVFFYPAFYFHPWIEKYIVGTFVHLNYTGDLMAFGFFPALGLAFYAFQGLREQKTPEKMAFFGLCVTFALAIAAAVVLLFSRGTIVFFGLSVFLFFLLAGLKFPRTHHTFFLFVSFGVMAGFLFWAGNLKGAFKEVGTLQQEGKTEKDSVMYNIEGAKRAIRMYFSHPVLGFGTDGYARVAPTFASPKTEKLSLPNYEAMCHYLHVLAEEGGGAFLYFLFLLTYAAEMARGLFMTKSRFKFVAALSFFSVILLVFGHGTINHLLQRFPVSLLAYIAMGVSLGILRDDFQHE